MATARSRAQERYSFDERNRLVIAATGRAADRIRPVRVLDGALTVDSRNRLVYEAAASGDPADPAAPRTIALEGDWSLTPDHGLALAMRAGSSAGQRPLHLKAAFVGAEPDAIVFALDRGATPAGGRRLSLSGRWAADARNRLVFLARKSDGSEDRLVLQGGWELGRDHALIYRYGRRSIDGRRREERVIAFDGAWDIPGARRLVYRVSSGSGSEFEFRASLRSPSLAAAEGRIAYEVGIGLSRGRRRQRVTLFGTWKLHRDLSVTFEIPYAGGRVQAVRFEGAAALSRRDRVAIALSAGRRSRVGLTVTFTRRLLPDASLFLRLQRDAEERAAIGGVQVRF